MVNTTKIIALVNALKNKFVEKEAGKGLSSNDYTTAEKSKLAGIEAQANKTVVDNSLSSSSENPVQNKIVKGALDLKANSSDLATVATTGDYDDLSDKPTISSLGGDVTVEKQTTAETGYFATYHVKQGGSKVGASINIPKDFLVKSATLETCSEADVPVPGYVVGDKYFDFVINTKDGSGTDEHLYVLVTDLIDTYTADESTLHLNGTTFSVKKEGIGTNQIATEAITSNEIGYGAVRFRHILYGEIVWGHLNASLKSTINDKTTVTDVDDEIDDYLDALTEALDPTNQQQQT